MNRIFPILFVFLFTCFHEVYGQYNKKLKDIFPNSSHYRNNYYSGGIGLTGMLPFLSDREIALNGDTALNLAPGSRMGVHLNFSAYRITDRLYVIKYLDYGLSYSSYRGRESFTLNDSLQANTILEGENLFAQHRFEAYINAHAVNQFSDNLFLQNSLGISISYPFVSNLSPANNAINSTFQNSPQLLGTLYYRLGLGIKLNKELIMIPSLQIPLIHNIGGTAFKAALPYFSSNFKPLIFSIQIMPFRQKPEYCTPVKHKNLPAGIYQEGQ